MPTETNLTAAAALRAAGEDTLPQIRAALSVEHQPQGPSENYFIEQMAVAIFQSTRYHRVGTGVFCRSVESYLDLHPDERFDSAGMADAGNALLGMAFRDDVRQEHGTITLLARLTDAEYRNFDRALRQLQNLQKKRASRAAA